MEIIWLWISPITQFLGADFPKGGFMVMDWSNESKKLRDVLVDTSALLAICENKADIFDLENEIGKVQFCITNSVLFELEKLAKKELKKKKCLSYLKQIIDKFKIIEDNIKYVDKSFVELADKDYLFITNDSELARILKNKGKRVFKLNLKKMFIEI